MPSPLPHHQTITEPHAKPTRRIAMLHGSFGAGRNLVKFAKQLLKARPDYAATLIDLPGHADSSHLIGNPTLRGSAEMIASVITYDAEQTGQPFDAVLGHSLGGKIALHLQDVMDQHLAQIWVIDSTPAPIHPRGEAQTMLDLVNSLPSEFVQRAQAVASLEEAGVSTPVAQWMATNLERSEAGGPFRWRFDPRFMQQLLDDFYNSDAWPLIERDDSRDDPPQVHFVKATGSELITPEAIDRINTASRQTGRMHLHEIEGRHWLHVDNPVALTKLLADHLPD